jgi:hypothetical protein
MYMSFFGKKQWPIKSKGYETSTAALQAPRLKVIQAVAESKSSQTFVWGFGMWGLPKA